MGSTNYGKLTNVSIVPQSSDAQNSSYYFTAGSGNGIVVNAGKYEFVTTCVNNNIIRISGGALGFPVL